jgi:RNA polymerase sigma factor (TIGR02999 family)
MNTAIPSGENSEIVLADKKEIGNTLSCEQESVLPVQIAMESSPITQLLAQWQEGDQKAFAELAKLVDNTLHKMARHQMRSEHSGHTLQATALIHEAYLRLNGKNNINYKSRTHFYNIAATKMRQILADYARARLSAKRGGGSVKLSLDAQEINPAYLAVEIRDPELVALDDALTRLAKTLPEHAKVVDLRYFGGFTIEETAEALEISTGKVKRHWQFARAWLKKELGEIIED